jgi:hypothetical protein
VLEPLIPMKRSGVAPARGIEHRLHWRLDVAMNEDQDRSRMDNGPYKLAILRRMAMNVMQNEGRVRCVETSGRDGMTPISVVYWPPSQMRLP